MENLLPLLDHNALNHQLLNWFDANQREMPWRKSQDPYKIWLSEIILQQTQVKQGTPYFLKFIEAYPTLKEMSAASEDELLKLWQGLGYYSRARNMHFTAKHIYYELKGKFPGTYAELLKLKGVGEYTAAAIASIAYNEPVAVLDGNVIRVLARLFEIHESFQTTGGLKKFKEYAGALLNSSNPGLHNQAMMELGSLVCKPTRPNCSICPVSEHCSAFLNKSVENFPRKKTKTLVRNRYFNFIVPVLNENRTVIIKRTGNDIWKNLYSFPLIESDTEWDQTRAMALFSDIKFDNDIEIHGIKRLKHILSHQIIHASFFRLNVKHPFDLKRVLQPLFEDNSRVVNDELPILYEQKFTRLEKSNIFEVDLKELNELYALPRLISRYLESSELNF